MISAMVCLLVSLSVYLKSQSTLHGAGAGDAACRHGDAAGLKRGQIADELPGAVLPGTPQCKMAAGLARHGQRAQASAAQIPVQRADRMIGDDVDRTCHRK